MTNNSSDKSEIKGCPSFPPHQNMIFWQLNVTCSPERWKDTDWDLTSPIASRSSSKQLHTQCCRSHNPTAPVLLIMVKLLKYRLQSERKLRLQILVYSEIMPPIASPSLPPPSLFSSFSPKALQFFYYFSKILTQAPGSIPTGFSIAQSTACQQPHGDGCSEPGRRAEICSPGKGRNVKITSEEDTNNGHPEDLRSQTEMPLHNRKKHKALQMPTQVWQHYGLSPTLYSPESRTKQRPIFLRLRPETVGL